MVSLQGSERLQCEVELRPDVEVGLQHSQLSCMAFFDGISSVSSWILVLSALF